jgi:ABC-type branched-subunit amino acid transport system substrate-binding protein
MRGKRSAWIVLLLVFAMVAASCSSDDSDDTTTTAAGGDETTETTAAQETTTTAAGGEETTTTAATAGGDVMTDIGVDAASKTIKIGYLADLTGTFAPLVVDITDGQRAYWDARNAAGGIGDGWTVELVIEDTNYNVEQHIEAYEKIKDDVVAIGQSTGSPTSVANLANTIEDNILFIPLSWYSGWAIPEFDNRIAFEQNSNYCIEAMNLLGFINEQGGKTIALATFPGDYGGDSAAGVRLAADFYGMEVVYDGEGAVIPGQDQTQVISEIVGSGADWAYVTTNASSMAEILGGAVQAGFTGMWTGSLPSYDFRLLDTPVGPILDQVWYQSAYQVTWGTDVPGAVEMREVLTAAYPDRRPSDAFVIAWIESLAIQEALEIAIANGDLTRQGVIDAANSITDLDFGGLAPPQSYAGTPNEYVQRELSVLQPNLDAYTAAGGAEQTLSQEGGGTTGSEVAVDFTTWELAEEFEFTAPCFEL